MLVTLVAVVCLGQTCLNEVVAPMPEPACNSPAGMIAATRFVAEHPIYGDGVWRLEGWHCVPGEPVRRQQAVLHSPDIGYEPLCLPSWEERCIWHRPSERNICFNVLVGCQNELASG